MCQDEDENEDEHQSFGSFWCIFIIMGDERTSTSSLLRTNEPKLFGSFVSGIFELKKCRTFVRYRMFLMAKTKTNTFGSLKKNLYKVQSSPIVLAIFIKKSA